MDKYDFSGWATRNDIRCSDGRTIRKDAFKDNDGQIVPLVWNHQHNEPINVLGHALLENRENGVYAYCEFNDTESGQTAKRLVEHGDVSALSIYANRLKQLGSDVLHGAIREVSLVLAGANPEAFIDTIIQHSGDSDEEAVIYTGGNIALYHSEDSDEEETEDEQGDNDSEVNESEEVDEQEEVVEHADKANSNPKEDEQMADAPQDNNEETVQEVFDTLSEKQKNVVYALIGQALEDNGITHGEDNSEGGNESMKHNVFDQDNTDNGEGVISHSDMVEIVNDAKRCGSMREAVLAHGIDDIEYLFPEAQNLNNPPEFIKREMGWVSTVMNGVHHTPFSRIKSTFADITEDDARAKGYFKGNLKKEEVFTLLKRTTTPTTIYKKQKLDRDDVVDITDFDVVSWLKAEMRVMLDEEIARAILVGDGRLSSSDDKINELNIRPIWKDEDLYTIKVKVEVAEDATEDQKSKAFIRATVKSRKNYKGSGNPVLYTTEDVLTDCLLMEDNTGRIIYESVDKLKSALRVSDIVTVPVMEGLTRVDADNKTRNLMGIIVNLNDYNVGADKGGAVNMFDDFDIDYNAMKYLIETRCSGALTKPFSAIVVEMVETTVVG